MATIVDPGAVSEVFCLTAGQQFVGAASFQLANGSRIDIGNYEHALMIYGNGGGTTAGTITFTPRESDSQTGPEFPLDGTNGAPDFRVTVPSAAVTGAGLRVLRVRARRRFLNVQVTLAATGNARLSVYLIGYGKRALDPSKPIETVLAQLGLT